MLWGDCEIEDDEFYLSERRGKKEVAYFKVRRPHWQVAKGFTEECNFGDMYYSDGSRKQAQMLHIPHRPIEKRYGKRLRAVNVKPLRQVVPVNDNSGEIAEASLKRYVTFYVTNFPPQASNFFLRKGFEVCGILEDVFVANNRNMYGEVFGFVSYANVRDVDKLLKAVNNVCFGQYCVCAVLARFDRKGPKKVGSVRKGARVGDEEGREGEWRAGVEGSKAVMEKIEGEKRKDGAETVLTEGEVGGVRVGKVMVSVRGKEGSKGEEGELEGGVEEGLVRRSAGTPYQTKTKKLVRKFISLEEDRLWAKRGMIGTVIGGESIPLIQSGVEDAGFKDIDIIPLGADKVFIHSLSVASVSEIVGEARHFFDLIFSSLSVWKQVVMPFQRGAWIRLYGIPLQAWNEEFFKLCVLDCGRYLRADTSSVNRERFDYARVLISTSSLDVINVSDKILVDEALVDIKIIEEWGFCLGDDACLYEEDDQCESGIPEDAEINDEMGINAEFLANKLANDVEDVDDFFQSVEIENGMTHKGSKVSDAVRERSGGNKASTFFCEQNSALSKSKCVAANQGIATHVQEQEVSNIVQKGLVGGIDYNGEVSSFGNDLGAVRKHRVHVSSRSTDDGKSLSSGPWSVDWLQNVQQGDIGLISSKKKRLKKVSRGGDGSVVRNKKQANKKRARGVLRHPVLTLKKVARLPSKDREEVMKVLKGSKVLKLLKEKIRTRRRQRARVTKSLEEVHQNSSNESSTAASVTNDWQNWVALKGSTEAKAHDINDIGKTIGVSFKGLNHNNFNVLSRSKNTGLGPVLMPLVLEEGEVDGAA